MTATKAKAKKPLHSGSVRNKVKALSLALPARGKIKRYICSSQQNNTLINGAAWRNLLALRDTYAGQRNCESAQILVSRFTYNKGAYHKSGTHAVKPGTVAEYFDGLWYDPEAEQYWVDRSVQLAPGLLFCGEMNILPTVARPLSGYESYTGRNSGIFPHAKIALESVCGFGDDATKMNYTTGTITQRNYLQRNAGLKAGFHHAYGALLVEVDSDGNWYCRQLNADRKGRIFDLDLCADRGVVTAGHAIEGLHAGDVHERELDPVVRKLIWGKGGLKDALRPKFEFFHDTLSFTDRNHHDMKDPHRMYFKHAAGIESVPGELASTRDFLGRESYREWCQSVVVDSNHDNAFLKWLKNKDAIDDHLNARLWLQCNDRVRQAIDDKEEGFHLLEWQLRRMGLRSEVKFLRDSEGFIICRDKSGGIQCGMHGHQGLNGARGSPRSLAKMGRRANTGHTHSASIFDGLYTSGTSSLLRLNYNGGPSSWSHSLIVTYRNGKRAIVTIWNGKYRA